jgi:uncharacterized membrane protein SpoIIM required for sporulation
MESKVGTSDEMNINSAASSSSSTADNFFHKISDFKQSLKERKPPKSLKRLNWVILGVLACTLILVSVDFNLLSIEIENTAGENDHNLHTVRRTNMIVQHASNVRTFSLLVN